MVKLARHRGWARGETEVIVGSAILASLAVVMWHMADAVSSQLGRVLLSLAANR